MRDTWAAQWRRVTHGLLAAATFFLGGALASEAAYNVGGVRRVRSASGQG
jgi:hypothetical protein